MITPNDFACCTCELEYYKDIGVIEELEFYDYTTVPLFSQGKHLFVFSVKHQGDK